MCGFVFFDASFKAFSHTSVDASEEVSMSPTPSPIQEQGTERRKIQMMSVAMSVDENSCCINDLG